MESLKIDYARITEGMGEFLTSEHKAVLSYGMIPQPIMELLEDAFKEKVFNIQLEQRGIEPLSSEAFKEMDASGLIKLTIAGKKLLRDFSHKMSVELLRRYCKL